MSTPPNPEGGDRDWREWPPPEGPSPRSSNPGGYTGSYPSGPPAFGGYAPGPPTSGHRPGVLLGAVVAWIIASLAAIARGARLLVVAGDDQAVEDLTARFEGGGLLEVPTETLQTGLVVGGVIVVVLGALVTAFALWMLTRRNWARVTVTVVGVLAGLLSVGTIIAPLVVIIAIALQFLPQSNQWFRTRSGYGYGYGPYG